MRAFLLLAGGVGADGRAQRALAGVDDDLAGGDRRGEAVQTAGRRPTLLLTDAVVLRTVARALEPLGALAPRDAAPEVHALLVEGDDPILHALEHAGRVHL